MTPEIAPHRLLAHRLLTGAANFRAVAPLPALAGACLRPEMLYRSGELSALTDGDVGIVETLGIKLICDLRSSAERQRFRARWPVLAPARVIEMPAELDRAAGMAALAERLAHEPGAAGARRAMFAIYAALPALLTPMMTSMFEAIASGWGTPVLIHCHIGKDRTGIAVALLLSALGVEREAILADYLATGQYLDMEAEARAIGKLMSRIIGRPIDAATASELVAADPAYLDTAFAAIARTHGSVEAYLAAAGLTPERRNRLRSLLLSRG